MTATAELVLYGSTTSPFVRKVRVALLETGMAHRFELAPPWSPTAGVERLNPLHKVPVLGLPDGTLICDSRVIVQYIDSQLPDRPLLPRVAADRIEVLRIEALSDGIGDAVALYTQEGWRGPQARSAFWLERQLAKVRAGIACLERDIVKWLPLDGPLQLAPIAAGAALGFASFWIPELAWRPSAPALDRLLDRLDARDSWRLTRPFLPPGATFPVL
ncbi:MAG: glutathione S-transferase N-terminal domain-containing protein [Chitinophagaceae bacterium]|nr:glutathione S-transferase N-terminal domain-containing protein [Rubrivivax sp.]